MVGRAVRFHLRHAHRAGVFASVHHDQFLQRSLVANGEDFLQLHVAGDKNNARPRIAQDIGGLVGRERGIDRDRDRSQQQGSEVGDCPLRPVLAQNGNPVTAADAPTSQPARHSCDTPAKRVRRNRAPFIPQLLQHHPGMLALHHGKEHIVKGAQAHSKRGDEIYERNVLVLPTIRQPAAV